MSQYQLSYDSSGNASLKEIAAVSTQKISTGTFNVSEYFAPRMDYGIDETFKDTNNYEAQLDMIQKKLLNQGGDKDDKGDKDIKTKTPGRIDIRTYTYNTLVNYLGQEAADEYMKYAKIEDFTKVANWATLAFPIGWLGKIALQQTKKYAQKKQKDIIAQTYDSTYYEEKYRQEKIARSKEIDSTYYEEKIRQEQKKPEHLGLMAPSKEQPVHHPEHEVHEVSPKTTTPFHPSQGGQNQGGQTPGDFGGKGTGAGGPRT